VRKQAIFDVSIDGASIAAKLSPILSSLTVSIQSGTHGDTAQIDLDDTGGRIAIPKIGAKIKVSLGWIGAGMREVFSGTVDEVRSSGARSGGLKLAIAAKGFDTTGKAKEGQERHFDDKTVKEIITAAAQPSGITPDVDPDLAEIVIDYIDMRGESLLHFGQRLARMVGGSFRVTGEKAILAKRAGTYTPTVLASRGINLHSWDITPLIGRGIYGKAEARFFNRATGEVEKVVVETGLKSDAVFVRRELCEDRAAAERAAKADAAISKERSGGGSVTIEGAPDAIPDGLCLIVGARAGINGSYRIKGVTHNLSRGGGYTTTLELAHPQGGE
jgi:phage protein D